MYQDDELIYVSMSLCAAFTVRARSESGAVFGSRNLKTIRGWTHVSPQRGQSLLPGLWGHSWHPCSSRGGAGRSCPDVFASWNCCLSLPVAAPLASPALGTLPWRMRGQGEGAWCGCSGSGWAEGSRGFHTSLVWWDPPSEGQGTAALGVEGGEKTG